MFFTSLVEGRLRDFMGGPWRLWGHSNGLLPIYLFLSNIAHYKGQHHDLLLFSWKPIGGKPQDFLFNLCAMINSKLIQLFFTNCLLISYNMPFSLETIYSSHSSTGQGKKKLY